MKTNREKRVVFVVEKGDEKFYLVDYKKIRNLSMEKPFALSEKFIVITDFLGKIEIATLDLDLAKKFSNRFIAIIYNFFMKINFMFKIRKV